MSHTINAALVGYGFAGQTFHVPFLTSTPGLSLGWVVSRDAAKVQAELPGCRVGSLAEVLADPSVDLVVIATPNDTHAPIAREALLAGKHVVIDKPFALDLAEAKALVELAEKQQRLLSIFHNRRWDGDFLTVRRLLVEGALGQVAQFESHFDRYRPEVRQRWREAGGPGSGLWFDLGPTSSISRSSCSVNRTGCRRIWLSSAPVPWRMTTSTWCSAMARCGSCCTAVAWCRPPCRGLSSTAARAPSSSSAWMCRRSSSSSASGGGGRLGVDNEPGQLSRIRDGQLLQQSVAGEAGDYGAYYRGVCAAIRGEGEPGAGRSEALAVMALLDLARDSAREGKRLACQILSD